MTIEQPRRKHRVAGAVIACVLLLTAVQNETVVAAPEEKHPSGIAVLGLDSIQMDELDERSARALSEARLASEEGSWSIRLSIR